MDIPTKRLIPADQLQPGTVIKTQSTVYPVMHWGVVGYGKDAVGLPNVWHSQKSGTLRCTGYEEFCSLQLCEIGRVPQNSQEAHRIIERLKSKEGLPWNLTQANCEMVVRWAVEDKAVSSQLAFAALAAVAVVALAVAASSSS